MIEAGVWMDFQRGIPECKRNLTHLGLDDRRSSRISAQLYMLSSNKRKKRSSNCYSSW